MIWSEALARLDISDLRPFVCRSFGPLAACQSTVRNPLTANPLAISNRNTHNKTNTPHLTPRCKVSTWVATTPPPPSTLASPPPPPENLATLLASAPANSPRAAASSCASKCPSPSGVPPARPLPTTSSSAKACASMPRRRRPAITSRRPCGVSG